MLSYLHSFHAGNRADLHKHAALLALIAAMRKEPAPMTYVETHAGRGRYDLFSAAAKKTNEHKTGAGILWRAKSAPRGLSALRQAMAAENEDEEEGELRFYPGSPLLAAKALRQRDRLELCELHPREAPALRQALARFRRARIRQADGLAWMDSSDVGLHDKRALVLIDPSFEEAKEYADLGRWLPDIAARRPNATFCLWLPLLPDERHKPMLAAMAEKLAAPTMLASVVWGGGVDRADRVEQNRDSKRTDDKRTDDNHADRKQASAKRGGSRHADATRRADHSRHTDHPKHADARGADRPKRAGEETPSAARGLIGSALVIVRAPEGLAGSLARVQRDLLKLCKAPEKGSRVERLSS